MSCPVTGKLLRRFAVVLFTASSYTVGQSLPHWCHGDCRGSKPPEAVYRENPSKSERLRFRWAKNRDSLPYGLPSLQQALIQLGNLFLTGVTGIAGEVNRRRRFTGRIPRSLRDFVFAGRKTGILSPMAFLAYSKLLYSWAISSSLVSLGLPGQQASA